MIISVYGIIEQQLAKNQTVLLGFLTFLGEFIVQWRRFANRLKTTILRMLKRGCLHRTVDCPFF